MPSCSNRVCCSAVGAVTRLSRISRPSVVGSTMSALCRVAADAKARMGESAEWLAWRRCLSVTHIA